MKLKISEIEPNREQPRKSFDEDGLIELSESIKQFGVLQPILVQKKMIIMRSSQGNGDGGLQSLPESKKYRSSSKILPSRKLSRFP